MNCCWSRRLCEGCVRIAIGSIVLFALSNDARAVTIRGHLPDFELRLPAEFVELPEMAQSNPNFIHYLLKGQPGEGEVPYALAIQKLGGVIGREPLELKHLPPNLPNPKITSATWQGFQITVVESTQEVLGRRVFSLAAQIPLKLEAIQVVLAGDSNREAELRQDLQMVLKSLEGPSNWIPAAIPGLTDNKAMLIGMIAGAFVASLICIYLIARKKSYYAALMTSFMLLVVSNVIRLQGARLREVQGISGVMGITGTAGLLLMGFLYARRAWQRKRTEMTTESNAPSSPVSGAEIDEL